MRLGIVGLPNVGKSTLFNAITNAGIEAANYPFCTIEPNVGVVSVPDSRIDKLVVMFAPEKVTRAVIEFVDIAGLVRGAGRGEGLGNQFLSNIREVDAILHVVRCFPGDEIVHVENSVDPLRDIEIINLELIFSDLEIVDKRLSRLKKTADKTQELERKTLSRVKEALEAGRLIKDLDFSAEENEVLAGFNLITKKPVIYVMNVAEGALLNPEADPLAVKVFDYAKENNSEAIAISAKIEEELSSLAPDDKAMFLADLGLMESGLDRLAKLSYSLLNLISYITAGKPEVRAWTITRGTKAPGAAGKIHSDFERGFIRAEVVHFDDLIAVGGIAQVRAKGLLRSEGKEYVVKDGDVIHFLFNV